MKYLNLILAIIFTICALFLMVFSIAVFCSITREPSTFMYWYGGLLIFVSCCAGLLYTKIAMRRWELFIQEHDARYDNVLDDDIIEAIELVGRKELKQDLQFIHEECCVGIVHEEAAHRANEKL